MFRDRRCFKYTSTSGRGRERVYAFLSREHFAKAIRYLKENRSADFIVAFMLLLVAAAFALSLGQVIVSQVLGDLAYFSIVIAVALQLVGFIRNEGSSGEKAHGTY